MVKSVLQNSGAGLQHPEDPSLRIPLVAVVNAAGLPDMGSGQHAYGYANGMLITDTWTVNGAVYVKTYNYTNGLVTGETDWVKQ